MFEKSYYLSEMSKITGHNTVSTALFTVMKLAYEAGSMVTGIPDKLMPSFEHARELFDKWEATLYHDTMEELLEQKTKRIQNAENSYAEDAGPIEKKHKTFTSEGCWTHHE